MIMIYTLTDDDIFEGVGEAIQELLDDGQIGFPSSDDMITLQEEASAYIMQMRDNYIAQDMIYFPDYKVTVLDTARLGGFRLI